MFWDEIAPFFDIAEYRDHFMLFALVIITHFQCHILSISLSAHLLHKYSVGLAAIFSVLKLVGYALAFGLQMFTLRAVILVDLVCVPDLVRVPEVRLLRPSRTIGKASVLFCPRKGSDCSAMRPITASTMSAR